MVDTNNSSSWSQGLDFVNNLELWMTWTTPAQELKPLDTMTNSGLLLTWKILGLEVKALDAMNSSRMGLNEWLEVMSYGL